jgi:hypothetical protein
MTRIEEICAVEVDKERRNRDKRDELPEVRSGIRHSKSGRERAFLHTQFRVFRGSLGWRQRFNFATVGH